jgi:hypothetical protein
MSYFDNLPNDQPIMPPTQPVVPVQPPPSIPQPPTAVSEATGGQFQTAAQAGEWVGLPVRASGDRVFLLKGGKRYWITSPAVLNSLGLKLGDEVKIDMATLMVLPEGEPLR